MRPTTDAHGRRGTVRADLRRLTARCSSSTTDPTWSPASEPTASTSVRTTCRLRSARALVGPDRLIGLSTHSPAQVDAAAQRDVDYIGVGPVHATPDEARPAGRRPRARALRRRPRGGPVLRDRRDRAGQRRSGRGRRRGPDRGRPRADRVDRPQRGWPASSGERSPGQGSTLGQRSRKRGQRQRPPAAASSGRDGSAQRSATPPCARRWRRSPRASGRGR